MLEMRTSIGRYRILVDEHEILSVLRARRVAPQMGALMVCGKLLVTLTGRPLRIWVVAYLRSFNCLLTYYCLPCTAFRRGSDVGAEDRILLDANFMG